MNQRHGWWLPLLALGLLVFPETTHGQEGSSGKPRRPYVSVSLGGDVEQLLRKNLERAGIRDAIQNLLQEIKNNPDLIKDANIKNWKNLPDIDFKDHKDLIKEGLEELKKNPELMKKIKEKRPDLTDEKIKKITDEAKKFEEEAKQDSNPDPDGNQQGQPPIDPKQMKMRPGIRPPMPPPNQDFSEGLDSDTAKSWLERIKNWKVVGEMLNESEALQGMVNDFTGSFLNNEGDGSWNASGLADKLGGLADLADRGNNLFSGWSGFSNLRLPSLPSMQMPHLSLGSLPAPNLGGPGGGGGGGTGFAIALVWVALAFVIGLLLWQIFARFGFGSASKPDGSGWQLGPWPVDPNRVATNEELILAFEFLALLLLGPASRSWNHRDIAAGMGGQPPRGLLDPHAAANRLADLYEEARYAPEKEPLTGEALAEARRNLCYLAGVAAA